MKAFVFRWLATTFAVFVAAPIVGIQYDGLDSLLAASLLLGVMNAFVRPVLLLLSLPFILFTLGFFILFINALLLMAVSAILPGFHVPSMGTAFFGAILIGLVSWLVNAFFGGKKGAAFSVSHSVRVGQSPFDPGNPGNPGNGGARVGQSGMKQAKGRVIE